MQKCKNFREIFYYFLIFFVLFQGCKPKYLEEVNPQNQSKNNKMGIKTAQKWWQKQKTNRQNLQQKGGNIDSTFENSFVPDWKNAESRLSAKGKLQIRVPLNQKSDSTKKLFSSLELPDGEKQYGFSELLLQANADSSFNAVYNITTSQDSINRFDPQQNNFFRKQENFTGSDFFYIKNNHLFLFENSFVSGKFNAVHPILQEQVGCLTFIVVKDENGILTMGHIAVPCDMSAGMGWTGFSPIKYVGQPSNNNGGVNTGGSSGVGNAPDPFEPEDYEMLEEFDPRNFRENFLPPNFTQDNNAYINYKRDLKNKYYNLQGVISNMNSFNYVPQLSDDEKKNVKKSRKIVLQAMQELDEVERIPEHLAKQYHIAYNQDPDPVLKKEGYTRYNPTTGKVEVILPNNPIKLLKQGLEVHEFKHLYQFAIGKISFNKITGYPGVLYDLTDEIEAYEMHHRINFPINYSKIDIKGERYPAGNYEINQTAVLQIGSTMTPPAYQNLHTSSIRLRMKANSLPEPYRANFLNIANTDIYSTYKP